MAQGGEFGLIKRYFDRPLRDRQVTLGIGDDAAIVQVSPGCELVVAVDMMVASRHFRPDADARSLGHKILAVNLSDIAAMGARPRWALLAGALPELDERWLDEFTRGLFALAEAHDVALIGGDTTRGPRNVCLTIAGEVPAGTAIRRAGALPGDDVWVSGTLGDAMLALAVLQGTTTLDDAALAAARRRLDWPMPRVALGQSLRGLATAMLDVSDGLSGDLAHILDASGVGAVVEVAKVPRSPALDAKLAGAERDVALGWLLAGGDDYELCFTAPPARRHDVNALSNAQLELARVGVVTANARELIVLDESGMPLPTVPRAFDHFA
jgi:thiamine-monophosphate kinase